MSTNDDDRIYWARREAEERAQAEDESCPARSVHQALADGYATLLNQRTHIEISEYQAVTEPLRPIDQAACLAR